MGKGSVPRPFEVPREEFRSNWDKIFGRRDPKEEKSADYKEDKPRDPNQKDTK